MTTLNDEQKAAAEHWDSPLLVTAGPGSGKTLVITERIKFLLNKKKFEPSEIICLTFSEKAANSIRDKLEKDPEIIDKKIDLSQIQISTYHSFCMNFLLENSSSTGIGMHGGIVNRATFLVWGLRNIDKFEFDRHIEIGNNAHEIIEKMMDGISAFNDELVSPEELREYVDKKLANPQLMADVEEFDTIHKLDNMQKMYKKYVQFKKEIDVMDFDDLIVMTNKILEDPEKEYLLDQLHNKFKYVLVDEFQDNNHAQFSLVQKIQKGGNITVVGDPDQNIYRFQGAYTQIFKHFKQFFPSRKDIFLSKNYRNPKNVIGFANEMLCKDTHREPPPKMFESQKSDDSKVNIVECSTDYTQAEFVKNKIIELKETTNCNFKDFAILSRKQRDCLQVAQMLVSEGIPVKYVGKTDIHTSSRAKFVFSLLKIIADPMNSMIPITLVLQEYGITEQNISRINLESKIRAKRNLDGDYAFDVISDQKVSNLTQKDTVQEIHSMLTEFIELAKGKPVSDTLYKIIRNETAIYKDIASDDSVESFIERSILSDIIKSAHDLEKINPDATIDDFLNFIKQLIKFDVETKRGTLDEDAVQVSTVHQSKGLEFKIVFAIDVATRKYPLKYQEKSYFVPDGLSKGVIPAAKPKIEFEREERRILYVAMTRAIDRLFVTYPTHYGDNIQNNNSSKFIQKLKLRTNPLLNFERFEPILPNNSAHTFDAIEIIKNGRIDEAIGHLQSGQYQSVIQNVIDLVKIAHFQKNKKFDNFTLSKKFELKSSENIEGLLNGTESEKRQFSRANLSVSSIEPYEKCPKQFWYEYVLDALPENQSKTALVKGDLFHKIVEQSSKHQLESNNAETYDVLEQQLNDKWKFCTSFAYIAESVKKENEDKNSLKPALKSFANWTKTTPNKIVALEYDFTIKIGGIPFKGKIDRLDETPEGELVIIDYKTGGKKKKIEKINESIQLNVYCMAVKESKWKDKPIKLASFFYPEKSLETIDPVSGKAEGQWFDYEVNDVDVKNVREKLEEYITNIKAGKFDATPDEWGCKYCDYKDVCSDSEAISGR
jgi:DNA helicase-2/ATP-dependent DNA helicase PcrA